ncbi:MAG: restriction endonuclease [Novosphingobium sp. 28-62-57]|uniref:HNH endonuclease n=1 Tax=Novosphingobium sp. 28-62-57 TaxID=1970409 RepID=UPI000BCA485F|nr:HNH endonuclease [Novosphingobium sp. 28-62-57]OYW46251.1 MAG: restriction endonuclease [Novosphingobium sp. 12-63-9]OYZ08837.1 MAG: restriction endonuclease [Novosphingobium sp. 28-62-57]
MVKIFVGVTHKPWFDFLAGIAPDEVNFWQPSGSGEFKALQPGDLFLFKLKGKDAAIAGGGVFGHASLAPLSLAWEAFGPKNGNASLAEMRATIVALRRESAPLGPREDPVIGCRILTEPFFWPRDLWIPVPDSFSRNIVVGKGYATDTEEGLRLWDAVSERLTASPAAPRPVAGERFGAPVLMRQRLGQGAFRLAVTDGYGRRCAVSGEKTLPILDAAHIRAYGDGGEHELANGLLLRTDIHRLFDLGYVTVSERRTFAVSERLKADFDNGVHYYAMQGTELAAPHRGFAPPAPEALRWHRENRYLG